MTAVMTPGSIVRAVLGEPVFWLLALLRWPVLLGLHGFVAVEAVLARSLAGIRRWQRVR